MRTDLHYGVAVGIDRYPGLSNLSSARKDAVAFHAWLQKAGVNDGRLELVCIPDGSDPPAVRAGARPDADAIWEALWDKVEQVRAAVKANPAYWSASRLYFFFSGHGIAPTARDASGLAANSSLDLPGNSASIKALVEYLLDSGDFAELVMVADCCRNMPQRGTQTGRPPWLKKTVKRSEEVKLAQMYATIYGDPAREPRQVRDPDSERGYYTRAILEGLGGSPLAQRPDGTVTTESLHGYARQRVIDLTGGKQKPPLDAGSDLVLMEGVPITPPGRRSVRIKLPAGYAGPARLLDGTLTLVDSWSAGGGDRVLPLAPSLYQVEADGEQFADGGLFRVTPGEGEFVVQL
jgi:hypothetical protein